MKRDLSSLVNEVHDAVIIGGGIYGLSAAWAMALRGLKVAVLEKNDFGAATSSGSLKLVHGGLRYLQHLDFARMRVSIGERRHMLRMAPHLVHPLPFLMPCQGWGIKGPEIMRAALLANDILSADRNRGQPDSTRRIPNGRIVQALECRESLPDMDLPGLRGAAMFYDAQMYSSERLTLAFGLAAAEAGAALANYAEVTGWDRSKDGTLAAAQVRDVLSGDRFSVRGRQFINLTGPWADVVLGYLRQPDPNRVVRRSKGIQLILPGRAPEFAFAVESRQKDKAALIARGNRSFFVVPWRGSAMIGTTDSLYEGDPDGYGVTEADLDAFMAEFKSAWPSCPWTRADVKFWCGGLRPLGDVDQDPDIVKASNQYEFIDHARTGGPANLLTVVGVKYTVARALAERAAGAVVRKLGRGARAALTDHARLPGGDISDWTAFERDALAERRASPVVTRHLLHCHGTAWRGVLALADAEPALAKPLPGSSEVIGAEIVHAAREEMAISLADVIFRRTDLGSQGHPGAPALDAAADWMARERGWTPDVRARERAAVEAVFRPA